MTRNRRQRRFFLAWRTLQERSRVRTISASMRDLRRLRGDSGPAASGFAFERLERRAILHLSLQSLQLLLAVIATGRYYAWS